MQNILSAKVQKFEITRQFAKNMVCPTVYMLLRHTQPLDCRTSERQKEVSVIVDEEVVLMFKRIRDRISPGCECDECQDMRKQGKNP